MESLSPGIIRRIDTLIAKSPGAMVALFDFDGNYIFASPSHHELLGYQPEELVGHRRLGELIAPEDLEHTNLAFMDALLGETSVEIGINLIAKSGEHLRVRAQAWKVAGETNESSYMLGRTIPVTD